MLDILFFFEPLFNYCYKEIGLGVFKHACLLVMVTLFTLNACI